MSETLEVLKRKSVERFNFPDSCVICQDFCIGDQVLYCNYDGVDILPFQVCDRFKRLKFYINKNEE